MDVNFRKTATDTAYIVVGVGVLGFQQAQVKRRDAVARVGSLRKDARSSLAHQSDSIKARTSGCAASLTGLGSTVGDTVSNLGSTVTDTVSTLGSTVGGSVGGTVASTLESVGSQVKAGAGAARIADPRVWAEPVVGDLRVRVEPVIEQLRTISLPGSVSAIPEQISKTIEVGKARVQNLRGTTPPEFPTAVNGEG
jgi:hypothetical protein